MGGEFPAKKSESPYVKGRRAVSPGGLPRFLRPCHLTGSPTDLAAVDCTATAAGSIRVVTIDGLPWFVAIDVCRTIDLNTKHGSVSHHVEKLDRDEQAKAPSLPDGEVKAGTLLVSESGLYKAEAKEFQNWFTKVVLPAIRSGALEGYTPAGRPRETPIASY